MITALGTKPNILHAVRPVQPAHSRTGGTRQDLASRRSIGSRSPSAQSTAQFIFLGVSSETGGHTCPGVGEREESQPEPAVLLAVPFLGQSWSPVTYSPFHAWGQLHGVGFHLCSRTFVPLSFMEFHPAP